jgi:hypothetical protein
MKEICYSNLIELGESMEVARLIRLCLNETYNR